MGEFAEALKYASHILREAQPFQVITHGDVDGVAAGALAASAFDCEVIIQKRLDLEKIDPSRFTLFLDLGSSQLEEIKKGFTNYLVVDHHPGGEDTNVLNPWIHNIDGTRVLCTAATFYLVVKQLGESYKRLSYLGVVGILGDRQLFTGENAEIVKDATESGVLKDDVLFGRYNLSEFVEVVNACCRHSRKELALKVCLLHNYEEGRKELEKYRVTFQKDLDFLTGKWDVIEQENRGRTSFYVHDTSITPKYAGELATFLARKYGKTVIILVNDSEGIKISGRSVSSLVKKGVDLGKAFRGFGGGHDIAAGAFLESPEMIETFIRVTDERLHHMVTPVVVTLDIPVKDAEKVMKALVIDNEGYDSIHLTAADNHIIGKVEGLPGTVKNITDDIIACIISAVHIMEED
ncbi:MAG: DHH family phosphoesterase [Theionarchaea archaeon]|nr:DHH family phosphoesterase [Theionarchaea archaeon]